MPDVVRSSESPPSTVREFARVAVPVIIAAASVALVLVAIGGHAVTIDEITAGPDQATPYSSMEARVPQPAQPEDPAPTF